MSPFYSIFFTCIKLGKTNAQVSLGLPCYAWGCHLEAEHNSFCKISQLQSLVFPGYNWGKLLESQNAVKTTMNKM